MNITVDMVASLTVRPSRPSPASLRGPWCTYEILLNDGSYKEGCITSWDLRPLIKVISQEKISYLDNLTLENFKKHRVRGARIGNHYVPSPESVLSDIFLSHVIKDL